MIPNIQNTSNQLSQQQNNIHTNTIAKQQLQTEYPSKNKQQQQMHTKLFSIYRDILVDYF